jgi:hypothetical protein
MSDTTKSIQEEPHESQIAKQTVGLADGYQRSVPVAGIDLDGGISRRPTGSSG